MNEAIKTAEQKRKEAVLEAKDEAFKLKAEVDAQKAEADKEIKRLRARRSAVRKAASTRETALDRRTGRWKEGRGAEKKQRGHEERLPRSMLCARRRWASGDAGGHRSGGPREVAAAQGGRTDTKAVRVAACETDLKEELRQHCLQA